MAIASPAYHNSTPQTGSSSTAGQTAMFTFGLAAQQPDEEPATARVLWVDFAA
jgi:hypothetical protein